MFKNKDHLSIIGIGPFYFVFLILFAIVLFVSVFIFMHQTVGQGGFTELSQLIFTDTTRLKDFLYEYWLSWNFLSEQALDVSSSLAFSSSESVALIIFMLKSILAVVLFIFGFTLWFRAIFKCRMVHSIRTNSLMTNDVYAYTRNPVYTAMLCIATSVVLCVVGFIMATVYIITVWVVLTLLLKNTEEKWLKKVYQDEYLQYCQRVNRVFPKFF